MDQNIKTPLVSVILPVFNSEKYLVEAMESILNQSYSNIEFIVINDGSTDASEKIIAGFNDERIKIVNNHQNKGLIYSLNTGINHAKGKYIARMDADDISLPDRLKFQVEFLENYPAIGICSCDYYQFSNNQKWFSKSISNHETILVHLLFNCSIAHPTLLIRKNILDSQEVIYDAHFPHAEDYELWSRLVLKCKISSVEKTLFNYRIHRNQITQKYHQEQIESGNKIRRKILADCGFKFDEEELRVHCLLGSSTKIVQLSDLVLLRNWLEKLINQNQNIKLVDHQLFTSLIGKYWYDACGNTNLGITAFRYYFSSKFLLKNYSGNTLRLFAKCMIRKFKFLESRLTPFASS